jgi:Rrf2 family protein
MNFSKTASYSLNVLSFMASNEDRKMSAAYLHEKLTIPYPYLRQVLTGLTKSGFIRSTRGRSGGFTFRKPKEQIYLADIIDATDGLDTLDKCILGFTSCPFNNQCSMHTLWDSTRNTLIKILKETSLADVMNKRD